MSLAIHELEQRAAGDPRAVHEFLHTREFPIVEGSRVTFVYTEPADAVLLCHWIYGLAQSQPFVRMHGGSLWFLVLEVPEGSRVEYKLEVHHGHQKRLIQDPLNPHLANDPFGANSVVHGAGYEVPDWIDPDPEVREGEVREHRVHSKAFGEDRDVLVYLPARFRPRRRYPLLVVHDGHDYLRFTGLQTILDNLVHRLEIAAPIVALTSAKDRMGEYAADPRHADFIVQDLLPELEESFPIERSPSARGMVGASFGGVASLSTAWRHPGVFDHLLLQSGSFVFTDIGEHDRPPVFDPVVEWMNEFRKAPGLPAKRMFLSCGTYESLIYYNRSMVPFLQSTGVDVRYREVRDGHNWENWRDRLREGLSWLLPGPLWMVYE